MYGTVTRYRLKPGSEDAALTLSRELAANPPAGFVGAYMYRLDGGGDEYITAAVYSDRITYTKNANDERQQRWFERFRALLAGDPEWNDGEVIEAVQLSGGSG